MLLTKSEQFFLVLLGSSVVQMWMSFFLYPVMHDTSLFSFISMCDSVRVGVYYYPWYAGDFHGGRYLREKLVPQQAPALGEYDDRREEVIGQHLSWMHQANVNLLVVSWFGPHGIGDNTTLGVIMNHRDLGDTKIALFYETKGRTDDFRTGKNVLSDISYISKRYFPHPRYFYIGNRPVLVVYITRKLNRKGLLPSFAGTMRTEARKFGFDIYLIGDDDPSTSSGSLPHLDAVTRYDGYGRIGKNTEKGYAGQGRVDAFFDIQLAWRNDAMRQGAGYIPCVSPGYNDRAVRNGNQPLSRKLNETSEHGSLFRAMLQRAVPLIDRSIGCLLFVNSWNEWHEDTQIEPTQVVNLSRSDISASGVSFTHGLDYEGYGMRYLNILQMETSKKNHLDVYMIHS